MVPPLTTIQQIQDRSVLVATIEGSSSKYAPAAKLGQLTTLLTLWRERPVDDSKAGRKKAGVINAARQAGTLAGIAPDDVAAWLDGLERCDDPNEHMTVLELLLLDASEQNGES